jgi:glyceraldehyde-3-phosphate dehydrogenase/erythrose-4-phosphate dehydrogenase
MDTNDWNEHPRKTPAEITQSILDQLEIMKTKPQFRGSIILLHDGGGDRSATVAALPVLIDALRAHGYSIVPVSALLGKTTAEVMPKLTFKASTCARCPTPSPSPAWPSSASSSCWSSSWATF